MDEPDEKDRGNLAEIVFEELSNLDKSANLGVAQSLQWLVHEHFCTSCDQRGGCNSFLPLISTSDVNVLTTLRTGVFRGRWFLFPAPNGSSGLQEQQAGLKDLARQSLRGPAPVKSPASHGPHPRALLIQPLHNCIIANPGSTRARLKWLARWNADTPNLRGNLEPRRWIVNSQ